MALGLLPPVVAELMMDIHEFKAGANEAETRMGALTDSGSAMFNKIGKATALGTAAIGIASIKMASDFETQMTRLYTAAGAPKAAVQGAYGEVLKMGDAVGFSGTQMAEALYHPVSAGLDLKTSLQAVKYAAEEAQISGASLDDTTYSLSSVMKAFNQNADQAHTTMALLNAIVGQGDMRFQDFNVSVKNWAPTAAQMGISIQSMGAALAYLTDRGNSAEEASTRVTMGLTMMAYPSQKAAGILESLGVASTDVQGSSDAMTAALRKAGITQNELAEDLQRPDGIYVALTHLKTALADAGVSGTEADAAISKIFGGGRSDKAILSLLQNLDGLKTKFNDIGAASGQFDQAWSDTQQTFGFKMRQLGADIENVGISIGTKLIPPVEAGVGWFAKHKAATEALALVIGGVLTVSVIRFTQTLTTSFLEAIGKAVVGIKSLGTTATATAAETEGAQLASTKWSTTLGNAIPVIGGVIVGAAALGNWLSHLGEKSVDATAALNDMTNKLLDLAAGTQATGAQLDQMAGLAMKVGGQMQTQLIDPIDKGLANLVSSGHMAQAQQALADIDAKLTAAGQSADKFNSKLKNYNDALGTYALNQREAALSTDKATGAAGANADALGSETGALNSATDAANGTAGAINAVNDAFSQLTGNISANDALSTFQKDVLGVSDALKQNGTDFGDNTISGLKNEDAFRAAAKAVADYRDAQIKNGVETDAANKTAADQATQLINVWEQLTGNKKAVDAYATSLGLIPKNLYTDVTVNMSQALAAFNQYQNELASITGDTTHAFTHKAGGGQVRGGGTTTSDSIPAMLSDTEYVIQASAVRQYGVPFLDALNAGSLSVPAAPASAASYGGSGYGGFAGSGGFNNAAPNIYIYLDGQEISGELRSTTLQYDQRNSGNGWGLSGGGFR